MPILNQQSDISRPDLLTDPSAAAQQWWACYTLSRQEKKAMQKFEQMQLGFYAPMIEKKFRSPNGRLRKSFLPLFPNYVFLCGDEESRHKSLTSGCLSRVVPVADAEHLVADLANIQRLILCGLPISAEERLQPGCRVRVKNGVFKNFEGTLIRRENATRLLVSVSYMSRGASVALDDCQVEEI